MAAAQSVEGGANDVDLASGRRRRRSTVDLVEGGGRSRWRDCRMGGGDGAYRRMATRMVRAVGGQRR